MGNIMKMQKGLEDTEQALQQDITHNKAHQEEENFLNLLRQGKAYKEAYEAIGREETWANETIKNIAEAEPERLKGIPEEIKNKAHTKQSEEEKGKNKANEKLKKAVMGFRAEQEKMEVWKLYADATGQEIGVLCTTAIDEYISRHKLNENQQQHFDLKKKTLEAEKKIKNKL